MTGYDTLAMHYIRRSLSYPKTAFVAILSTVICNNVGFPANADAISTSFTCDVVTVTAPWNPISLALVGFYLLGSSMSRQSIKVWKWRVPLNFVSQLRITVLIFCHIITLSGFLSEFKSE
jgi:hypothetical protein